jgi:hypothetical protein
MDRMPRYIPARERIIRLDKRRGAALFEYVKKLADGGDAKACAFIDPLLAGAFDVPRDGAARDSGIRLAMLPNTVDKPG